jgi:hypothetical protein
MALRPRFSTGLLFSDIDWLDYSNKFNVFAFHFSNMNLQECNRNFQHYCTFGIATTNKRPQLALPLALIQVWNVRWRLPV